MATIKPTVTQAGKQDGACFIVTWAAVTEIDTCVAYQGANLSDKSVHVSGTFGGATVAVQGSNNGGTSFAALNDPSSTVIAITAEKIKAILENVDLIKPVITGGAAQSLNIALLVNQNNPLRT